MQFSEEQQIAYEVFKSGENMFLTGPGGTGKSAFIRYVQDESFRKGRDIHVCAMTGCAAVMLECKAKTIHSWAGIGLCVDPIAKMVEKVGRNRYAKAIWKAVDILVVDEVSMMSQKIFETLDAIGKHVRRNRRPFGGIQLLFTGDFYQLPPVFKNNNDPAAILSEDEKKEGKFCFQSPLWLETFPWENHIQLVRIFRQTDQVYQKILNQIRKGCLKQSSYRILMEQIGKEPPEIMGTQVKSNNESNEEAAKQIHYTFKPTKLYPTRNLAKMVNSAEMSNLQGEQHDFDIKKRYDLEMTKADKAQHMCFNKEQMDKELTYLQGNLLCEPTVHLKIGTQVMCLVNIRLNNGDMICNGSQGIVVRFEGPNKLPVVLYRRGNYEMTMDYHVWASSNIPGIGISQIPLIHAWALTIHKSQGSTLEMAEIDAGSGIFECGQTYVALSRVKSLEGLYLSAFDPSRIRINGAVKEFYEQMEANAGKRKRSASSDMFAEFAYNPATTATNATNENGMVVAVAELIESKTDETKNEDLTNNDNDNVPIAVAVAVAIDLV
jgi:ATP-dependent DNA helicase PIF1